MNKVFLFLFMFVGLLIAGLIMGLTAQLPGAWSDPRASIYIGTVIQSTLVFLFPALLAIRATGDRPLTYLRLRRDPRMAQKMALGIAAFILSYASVSFINQWNQGINLPEGLRGVEEWMRALEDQAMDTTMLLLSGDSPTYLLLNLLIVAGVAAVTEEIFFRGALQQFLQDKFPGGHGAVWIASLLFSLIHLQFYGFFPRVILGALLGYLFLYTRNLWIPIGVHFINNATVIIIHYFWGDNPWVQGMEEMEITVTFALVALLSTLFTILLFRNYLKRNARAEKHSFH